MVVFPSAKINIGLNIQNKRNDGFHNIETVLLPIGLSDALEVSISNDGEDFQYTQSGMKLDGNLESNLIYKAYILIRQDYTLPKLKVHLHKHIPFGAGLGGGSSDAVAMIKVLNELCVLNLKPEQMLHHAKKLGSDCAFFLNSKSAFAWGKGDEMEELSLDLTGVHLVLVYPHIHAGTAQAYAGVQAQIPNQSIKEIIKQPIAGWQGNLVNDFETSIFLKYPEIESIKKHLYEIGANYASMSGSGSSVYGLFEKTPNLGDAFEDCFVWEESL